PNSDNFYPFGITTEHNNHIFITDPSNNKVWEFFLGFSTDLSNEALSLTCGTKYHYRAFATNEDGTTYGEDETFTTDPCTLSTVTSDTEEVTYNSAILK